MGYSRSKLHCNAKRKLYHAAYRSSCGEVVLTGYRSLVSSKSCRNLISGVVMLCLSGFAWAKGDYKTIDWTDLIPADDREALMNPPAYITDIVDGSDEDRIGAKIENAPENDRYQQALVSMRVNLALHGERMRVPGFVVPLAFNERQRVTQFLLVPYFGACLHLPPPPPNQIILVNAEDGIKMQELDVPLWISGELSTTIIENDTATAAYSMEMAEYEVYEE